MYRSMDKRLWTQSKIAKKSGAWLGSVACTHTIELHMASVVEKLFGHLCVRYIVTPSLSEFGYHNIWFSGSKCHCLTLWKLSCSMFPAVFILFCSTARVSALCIGAYKLPVLSPSLLKYACEVSCAIPTSNHLCITFPHCPQFFQSFSNELTLHNKCKSVELVSDRLNEYSFKVVSLN